jgi:hypothetical protein
MNILLHNVNTKAGREDTGIFKKIIGNSTASVSLNARLAGASLRYSLADRFCHVPVY